MFKTRLLMHNIARNNLPATFTVRTWPPGLKKKEGGKVITIHPMSYLEAKRKAVAGTRRIELYGHASAELKINFRHPSCSQRIIKLLTDKGINTNSSSTLSAYVSWFPKNSEYEEGLENTGRVSTSKESHELASIIPKEETEDLEGIKKNCLKFFITEYRAINSKYEVDIYQYGEPDPKRVVVLSSGLDFEAILSQCMQMMKIEPSSDGQLIMKELAEEATYFGLDMLRQYKELLSAEHVAAGHGEPIAPEHVCTTAVMRLLKAGIGDEEYKKICRKLIKENPQEFTHGLPLVPLMHQLAYQISLQERPKTTDSEELDITKPMEP